MTERNAVIAETLATFNNKLRALDAAIAEQSEAFVIRTHASGVYFVEGRGMGGGVVIATRYTERKARELAPRIRNGAGDVAQVWTLADALVADRAQLVAMIEQFSALA